MLNYKHSNWNHSNSQLLKNCKDISWWIYDKTPLNYKVNSVWKLSLYLIVWRAHLWVSFSNAVLIVAPSPPSDLYVGLGWFSSWNPHIHSPSRRVRLLRRIRYNTNPLNKRKKKWHLCPLDNKIVNSLSFFRFH